MKSVIFIFEKKILSTNKDLSRQTCNTKFYSKGLLKKVERMLICRQKCQQNHYTCFLIKVKEQVSNVGKLLNIKIKSWHPLSH